MPSNPNTVFLLFVTIICFGYLLKKIKLVSIDDSKSIINIILYFTLPAVVFKTFYHAELNPSLLIIFFISLGFGGLMSIVGIFFFSKNTDKMKKGLLMSSCMGFNIGLFAYPFVQALWGEKGLLGIAMFDLANAFIVYGVSYIISAINAPNIKKENYFYILRRLSLFVPLQCYIIAIILVYIPISYPYFVLNFLDIVSKANSVLVLIVIGMFLSFKINKSDLLLVTKVSVLRYGLGIGVGIILYLTLPVSLTVKNTVFLGLILPVGMSAIPYAVMFGYNTKLAGTLVNVSNVLSFIFMWVFIIII